MSWSKLPALTEQQAGLRSNCLNCGAQPVTIPLTAELAVGFGTVSVDKDGSGIWDMQQDDEAQTLQRFEDMAKVDPDHDWRVSFFGPLSESTYQRHGVGEWVLVTKGDGFA